MTNTVNIPTNMLPEDGRFGSGPSKIRPEQVQALDAGARNLLGTSHRQTPVKQVVGSIREGLSNFFQIPDGYEVVLGNGGASAFWDIACASLITRKAAFGTYGSFSAKFAKSAQSAPFLEDPEIFAGKPGTYRLPELTEYVDAYCWAHNENVHWRGGPGQACRRFQGAGRADSDRCHERRRRAERGYQPDRRLLLLPAEGVRLRRRPVDRRAFPGCDRPRLRHR